MVADDCPIPEHIANPTDWRIDKKADALFADSRNNKRMLQPAHSWASIASPVCPNPKYEFTI
jgi:hypothetical protein